MDFPFLFKKVVSEFLYPAPLIAAALILGVALLWSRRRRCRLAGRLLLSFTTLAYLLVSSEWFSASLLYRLEGRFPRFTAAAAAERFGPDWSPAYIVVLGAGHNPDPGLPPDQRLSGNALLRLSEGRRIHQLFPSSRLVVTGGSLDPGFHAMAVDMSLVLQSWGIPEDLIVVEDQSRDTEDHVRYLEERLGDAPFVLVTSPVHLPRAHALFAHAGLQPVPAPAGTAQQPEFRWHHLLPRESSFAKTRAAAYELMGLAWAKLRRQI